MKARLDLRLTQKLIMTPQLQQAIKLLQLSRMELSQTISQEMLDNPLLEDVLGEETTPPEEAAKEELKEIPESGSSDEEAAAPEGAEKDFDLKWDDYFDDYDDSRNHEYENAQEKETTSFEQLVAKATSLEDHLLWQLGVASLGSKEKEIGQIIIGNIDENGYLGSSAEDIARTAESDVLSVEKVLSVIQSMDPPGVAARDLKECLLIQISQLDLKNSVVEKIISYHLEDMEKKRYSAISKSIGISLEEKLYSVKIIERLEPKPGRPFSTSENQVVVPDVLVVKSGKDYTVVLSDEGLPKLRVSSYYRKLLREKGKDQEATRSYLDDKLRSALWLIRSIEQRNRTIQRVAESIVKFQKDFFDKGMSCLKPLILKQVAEDIQMHESTISRVTTNKYMYTPQGLFEFKYFFNSSIQRTHGDGDSLSSLTVKDMIKKLVLAEDCRKPLKDQDIVNVLKTNQIDVARRTVAKYRTLLNIPPATLR